MNAKRVDNTVAVSVRPVAGTPFAKIHRSPMCRVGGLRETAERQRNQHFSGSNPAIHNSRKDRQSIRAHPRIANTCTTQPASDVFHQRSFSSHLISICFHWICFLAEYCMNVLWTVGGPQPRESGGIVAACLGPCLSRFRVCGHRLCRVHVSPVRLRSESLLPGQSSGFSDVCRQAFPGHRKAYKVLDLAVPSSPLPIPINFTPSVA